MKRTAIIAAIAAITGTTAPYAVAELNEGSTLQDVISFTNGLDQRTNNAYAKAEEGTTIRAEHDRRMNVQSDRIYKSQLTGSSALHYDGDKVVTTDRDLTDTITGAVMLDEQGNALKVRELQKGSDDITLRGESGTGLHNLSAGTDDRDAVNVSQLKSTAQGLQDSIDGHSETLKAIDSAQQKESQDRIAGYNANGERITAVSEQKADKSDVNEVRSTLSQSTAERIATDAEHDGKIADLYDTKANATEVNEWLETKADKGDLATTNGRVAGNAAAINIANEDVAKLKSSKVDATTYEAGQKAQDSALMSEKEARVADVNDARRKASGAQSTADHADDGVKYLSEVKADSSDLEGEAKRAQGAETKLGEQKADRAEVAKVAAHGEETRSKVDGVVDHQAKQDVAIDNAQSTADAGLKVGNAAYTQSQMNAEASKKAQATADRGVEVGGAAYRNTQVNAANIDALNSDINAVDRKSAERSATTLKEANAYTDRTRDQLRGEISDVRKEARAGTAAAISLGQLQTPIHADKNIISVGAGSWKGQSAVSVGAGRRWGDLAEWSAKAGVSFTSQGKAIGGSVGYEF